MRALVWVLLGCLASTRALAGVWSDLWLTPDQQGEQLLRAGEPALAASRFSDPRLRAYAELEAGRYAEAAKLLAPYQDPTSEYNRGNALAKSGQLHAALASYDAALKQAPHDRDIRHNRDLVERALRRQPPENTVSHGDRQRAGASGGRGAQRQGARGGPRRSGTGRRSGGGAPRTGQSAAARQEQSRNAASAVSPSPGSRTAERKLRSGRSAQTGGSSARSPQASRARLRRDAALAAALARRRGTRGRQHSAAARGHRGPRTAVRARTLGGGLRTPRQKPASEKQLALEQWLRQIPDSPAGLLRRKFMIEYLLRHPDAAQEGR